MTGFKTNTIKTVILLTSLVVYSSCIRRQDEKHELSAIENDSTLKSYLEYCDSIYNFRNDKSLDCLLDLIDGDTSDANAAKEDILNKIAEDKHDAERLKRIKIEPLSSLTCQEAYRFTLSRYPCLVLEGDITITIVKKRDSVLLSFVKYVDQYEKDDTLHKRPVVAIKVQKERELTVSDWRALVDKIDASFFWSLFPNVERAVVDGSVWKIEGVVNYPFKNYNIVDLKNRRYGRDYMGNSDDYSPRVCHTVISRSPPKGSFFELGRLFVVLSKEDIGELY